MKEKAAAVGEKIRSVSSRSQVGYALANMLCF